MGGIWIEQRRVIAWRQGKNTLHLEWRCLHRRGIRKKGGSCFVISSDTDDGRQLAAMLTRHHPVPGTGNFWFFNLLSRTLIGYWLSYRGGSLQSFNLGWCTINLYVDPRLTYQLCLCSLCSAIHPMIGKHRLLQVWGLYFSHTSYLSAFSPLNQSNYFLHWLLAYRTLSRSSDPGWLLCGASLLMKLTIAHLRYANRYLEDVSWGTSDW